MTTFGLELEWNTISIQQQMTKHLESNGYKVTTSLGFENQDMSGNSAFMIAATKDRVVVTVELANERQTILIRGGLDGKYLPLGKKVPKFKQEFYKTKIKEASEYFVKTVQWCNQNA